MATNDVNNFDRLRYAKPVVNVGPPPSKPFKPAGLPKQGPPPMPEVLTQLLRSKKKGSAFYGD